MATNVDDMRHQAHLRPGKLCSAWTADRLFLWLALAVFAVSQLVVVPLYLIESDEGIFAACAARQIATQSWPLVNCIDIKPPGIFIVYEAVYQLFGSYNSYGMRFAAATGIVAAAGALGYHGKQLATAAAGRVAAAMFLLICAVSPFYYALKTEIFSVLFILMAMVCVEKYRQRQNSYFLLCAGVLIGCATLFKQPAILMAAACSFSLILVSAGQRSIRRWLAENILVAMGVLLPLCLVGVLYYAAGQGGEFYQQMWLRPYLYASHKNPQATLGNALTIAAITSRLPVMTGIIFLLGAIMWPHRSIVPAWCGRQALLKLLPFILIAVVIISLGSHFFASYFLYLWPFLILLMALTWRDVSDFSLRQLWQRDKLGTAALAASLVMALVCATTQTGHLKKSHQIARQMAAQILHHAEPQDQLYVWGYVPELYVATGKVPASRFVVSSILFGYFHDTSKPVPAYAGMKYVQPGDWNRFIADLRQARSFMLVDSSAIRMAAPGNFRPSLFPRLRGFMAQYCRYKTTVEDFPVYRCVVT